MRGLRRWLSTAALVAGASASSAQVPAVLPVPLDESPVGAALPGGTVVGAAKAPAASVTVLSPASSPLVAPDAANSVGPPAAPPSITIPPPAGPISGTIAVAPPVPAGPPIASCGVPAGLNPLADCCGPVGAHGPIGQEVYLRVGANVPLGDEFLPRALNVGWTAQIGARSQFFDPQGDTAWVVDVHLHYSYNNADSKDVVTVRLEPVFVRDLHRWAVGVGVGQDAFLGAPGFVGGTWDANFRLGWDVGGRWGTGHTNLTPLFEPQGYRRLHDVFAQAFLGVMGSVEVPIGGWTWIGGGRIEWDYTFSDLLEIGGSFHEVNFLLMAGVRY